MANVDSFFYANDGSCIVKTYGGISFDYENKRFNLDNMTLVGTAYFDKHGNCVKSSNGDVVETKTFSYTYHRNGMVKTCKNEEEDRTDTYDENGFLVRPGYTYDEKGNILIEGGKYRHVYADGIRQRIEEIENGKVVRTFKCDKYGNQLEDETGVLFSLTYFE